MQRLCVDQRDIQKIDFGPILTPKRVILAPILWFRGQITKNNPRNGFLVSKLVNLDVLHLILLHILHYVLHG